MSKHVRTVAALSVPIALASVFMAPIAADAATRRVAVFGDYGFESVSEGAVATMVQNNLNPDFIVTLGDNNYGTLSQAGYDQNVGQYYHSYIQGYAGVYGAGSVSQQFFPALGNHDYTGGSGYSAYLSFFNLPGNERYYDFVDGEAHFFVINSDSNEPDGRTPGSTQYNWLQNAMTNSTATWKFVFMHHPPYSSSSNHGSDPTMQWPFAAWGADAVFAGHDHTYERMDISGVPYFVSGLGGRSIYGFTTPIPQSQVRYNTNYGSMLVSYDENQATFEFWSITNGATLIDTLTLQAEGSPGGSSFSECEDFDAGFAGNNVGDHADWFDNNGGPVATNSIGVNGSVGLAPASAVFSWTAHPFNWNDALFESARFSMDFQTNGSAQFDDDRVGWITDSASTDSALIFGVQLDPGGAGQNIEGYWDGPGGADARPSIVSLSGLVANAWYRLECTLTKLSATSARVDVELLSLDGAGNVTGSVASGSIADTSSLGAEAPLASYFSPSQVWPVFKNHSGTTGAADNACASVTIGPPPPGACCLPDSSCVEALDATDCTRTFGGMFQGSGSNCGSVNCPLPAIVNEGATWLFLDDGSNQGTAWRAPAFDDSEWDDGPAQLGYGDGDEATVVSYGPDGNNKYRTTYFRHTVSIKDASAIGNLELGVVRDDGAIVYINGTEVFRTNMNCGATDYQTFAVSAVGGTDEDEFFVTNVNPCVLVDGDNVIAVEVHQINATSSDLGFDLYLLPTIGVPPGCAEGADAWVAYNDMIRTPSDTTIANTSATTYNAATDSLVDVTTGFCVPVTAAGTNVGGYDPHTDNGGNANGGTDAAFYFGGIVDLTGALELDASNWQHDMTFTGLDPSSTYAVTLTANRGEPTYAGIRGTRVTLLGADASTNDSTSGVVVNSTTSVSFSTGYNTVNGYVARWVGINPGADGSFAVRSEWDTAFGAAGGSNTKSYAMGAFRLEIEPVVTGACCFTDGMCAITTADDCANQGGLYQGDLTDCVPNLCPQPTGACCAENGSCSIQTADDCAQMGGTYSGDDSSCRPNLCPQPVGACCFTDGSCQVISQGSCKKNGGVYQSDGTTCAPNNCPQPPSCPADIVTSATFQPPPDGIVDGADLAYLLGDWGVNPGSLADIVTSATFQPPPDGIVDGADLAVLLGSWGNPCVNQ